MTSPHQQKLKIAGPVVITANRLADGAVVHRTADGGWTVDLEAAEILTDAEQARAALDAAQRDGLRAVGPYVAPVAASNSRAEPGNLRETIRRDGPTFPLPADPVRPATPHRRLEAALPLKPAGGYDVHL